MNKLGRGSLLEALAGADGSNPENKWRESFREAEVLSQSGQYNESCERLHKLLENLTTESRGGTLVDKIRSQILGMIGMNKFYLEEVDEARRITTEAMEACTANGDTEGVHIYRNNLRFMDIVDGRLGEAPRLIAEAQSLTDRCRYAESTQMLEGLLETTNDRQLLCKIYGLLGANALWSGNAETCRQRWNEAVATGGVEGARVYGNNLLQVDRYSESDAGEQVHDHEKGPAAIGQPETVHPTLVHGEQYNN